mmetsp:Transcript_9898/g.14981  ORF Transcript_9898/g.14981 Transcript_9898/m.14981 type:complete len:204 (-) Transcript_9898:2749-3360(-)
MLADEVSEQLLVELVPVEILLCPELESSLGPVVQVGGVEGVVGRAVTVSSAVHGANVVVVVAQEAGAQEDDEEDDNALVDGVTEHVSPHYLSHDGGVLLVRLSLKNVIIRGLGGEGQSGEGVHNEVHPQHLYSGQRGVLEDDGAEEHDEHSDDVHSQLELEELAHVIVDVTAIFESNDDRREVIIEKDDVRGALSNIGSGDSH